MASHRVYVDLVNSYVSFKSSPPLSDFHKYLTSLAAGIILKNKTFLKHSNQISYSLNSTFKTDKALFDIFTEYFYVEIETGLKHSFYDLKKRISKSHKMVFVIVPNQEIKDYYFSHFLHGKHRHLLKLCTIGEFKYELRIFLRNYFYSQQHKQQ
jgi:hypothetical protein